MIPLYEAYKDKGFTVVGIAREQNKESMLNALERDNYPWINLLELNDKNGIWTKFGIGNAGGGEFLVDSKGNSCYKRVFIVIFGKFVARRE
jgi:hypothetical protein